MELRENLCVSEGRFQRNLGFVDKGFQRGQRPLWQRKRRMSITALILFFLCGEASNETGRFRGGVSKGGRASLGTRSCLQGLVCYTFCRVSAFLHFSIFEAHLFFAFCVFRSSASDHFFQTATGSLGKKPLPRSASRSQKMCAAWSPTDASERFLRFPERGFQTNENDLKNLLRWAKYGCILPGKSGYVERFQLT